MKNIFRIRLKQKNRKLAKRDVEQTEKWKKKQVLVSAYSIGTEKEKKRKNRFWEE